MHAVQKALAAKETRGPFISARSCVVHYSTRRRTSKTVWVEAVTLVDALAYESEEIIDLVKMDIEGEEVPVLGETPCLHVCAQMTVEFHYFLDPKSVPGIRAVISATRTDFHAVRFSSYTFGDMLFVNQRLASLNLWQRVWLRLRYKYARGLGRVLGTF